MATKTATVQSGQVTGTHSNFPAYVDLSDVGVTTLAEAQSVRVYSNSSLTTELAREIVSATEMHVKVSSLSSTTQIWVDYDGVRSDYAVGATYGRNAVWSDYEMVYHMNTGNEVDVTGNSHTGTNSGTTSATGKLGDARNFDGTNDIIDVATAINFSTITVQCWANHDATISERHLISKRAASEAGALALDQDGSNVRWYFRAGGGFRLITGSFTTGSWIQWHGTYDGSDSRLYKNGSQVATTGYTGSIPSSSETYRLGRNKGTGTFWDGQMDEVRIRSGALSANWIDAEHNNQNDNAAFWGTWTDAGGGPTPNNSARRLFLMQM